MTGAACRCCQGQVWPVWEPVGLLGRVRARARRGARPGVGEAVSLEPHNESATMEGAANRTGPSGLARPKALQVLSLAV